MHPVTFALFFFIFLLCLSASLKRLCLDIDFSLLPVSFFFFVVVDVTCVFCLEVCVFPLDSYAMARRPPPRNVTMFEEALSATCVLHYFSILCCCVSAFGYSVPVLTLHTQSLQILEAFLFSSSRSLQRAAVFCIRCATLKGWHQEMHTSYFTPKSNETNKNTL